MAVDSFALPDLGEGLDAAVVVEWHVAPGDRVVADQPLVSVETDKAMVEIPAPRTGVVARLLAAPGQRIAVGAPLVEFGDGPRADPGAVVGQLGDTPPAATPAAPQPPADARPPAPGAAPRAMPAARALAARMGLDLARIAGTGPEGVITRADVEAAAAPAGGALLSEQRRAMARHMARAGSEVVPATLHDLADVTAWFTPEADVLARLVRSLARAAAAEPALNAWFDADGPSLERHAVLDLGIAVDTEAGLYVPVLRDAGAIPPGRLRAALDPLIAAARARRLAPGDLARPTLTLSSFGTIGGRHAVLVVSPPQVAILGAGRVHDGTRWDGDRPLRCKQLPLSLSFDHRAVTGGEAARFLRAVIGDLERPEQ